MKDRTLLDSTFLVKYPVRKDQIFATEFRFSDPKGPGSDLIRFYRSLQDFVRIRQYPMVSGKEFGNKDCFL